MTERDPNGLDPHVKGAKLDASKPKAWLCISGFARALEAVAEVTTKGADKYTPNGWRYVEDGAARYMEAFARHQLKLGRGERYDPETGCLHKAQMVWNLLASMELELRAGMCSSIGNTPTKAPETDEMKRIRQAVLMDLSSGYT